MSDYSLYLKNYVIRGSNSHRTKLVKFAPRKRVPEKREIIVYRGQANNYIDTSRLFFSTSLDKEIAEDYGSNLFKIHLMPGVEYINVNELIEEQNINSKYIAEQEYIVIGGGIICKEIKHKSYTELWYGRSCLYMNTHNNTNNNTNKRNTTVKRAKSSLNLKALLQKAKNESNGLFDLPNNVSDLTSENIDFIKSFANRLNGGKRKTRRIHTKIDK